MKALLETKNLTIGYQQPRQPNVIVSSDISLDLVSGELVCLLGPNGVGKSTLIRTITAMQPAINGGVNLMGESIHSLAPKQLARRISVVLTDRVNAGNMTAYALVALGRHPYTDWMGRLSRQDEEIVQRAIESVGALKLAGRKVNELSDGERQKVMIARALAQDPAVMVLDEPTAFLDLPHRANVLRILRKLAHNSNRAILLSTHDLDLALRSADRIWLMDRDGKLYDGAPEDLILNGAFQQIFCDDEVEFDVESGSFNFVPGNGDSIYVEGEGVPKLWTERALIRSGFILENNPMNCDRPKVIVKEEAGQTKWQFKENNHLSEFSTVHELVSALNNQAGSNGKLVH